MPLRNPDRRDPSPEERARREARKLERSAARQRRVAKAGQTIETKPTGTRKRYRDAGYEQAWQAFARGQGGEPPHEVVDVVAIVVDGETVAHVRADRVTAYLDTYYPEEGPQ